MSLSTHSVPGQHAYDDRRARMICLWWGGTSRASLRVAKENPVGRQVETEAEFLGLLTQFHHYHYHGGYCPRGL